MVISLIDEGVIFIGKHKEDDLRLFAKWFQDNRKDNFIKKLSELEIAIAEAMTQDYVDYIVLAKTFKVGVVDINGTRRNMVDRWKKLITKPDVGKFKIDNDKVRAKLKSLRESHGYTIQEVAKKTDISRSAILSWERLWTNPNLDCLLTIAEFYKISLNDFLKECLHE